VGSIFQTLSAVLVVGVFALAGADPILQLFTWMSGLATVSILVLMILTGVAIYTFFARTRVDSRTWHTKIAPVLGTLGLLVVLGLVLDNFTLLIGGSSTIAAILLLIVVGFFVAGLLRGISTRRSRSTEASRAIEHEPGELAQ
jgi:amino acid transporter